MSEEIEEPAREASAYPIEQRMMSREELDAAQRLIDVVSQVEKHGKAFTHLCRLLGEVLYWRAFSFSG